MALAINLIVKFEGFSRRPYQCPAGIWTIGYGTTRYPDGVRVTMKDGPVSRGYAEDCVRHECEVVARAVDRLIVVPLAEHERAALISFGYNIGTGNFRASTLRQKLNRGDRAEASAQFPRWRFANGRVLKGLVRRRAAERLLFERGAATA